MGDVETGWIGQLSVCLRPSGAPRGHMPFVARSANSSTGRNRRALGSRRTPIMRHMREANRAALCETRVRWLEEKKERRKGEG